MQTFLPYSSILKSVQCLDNKRLGKQRVEAMQILKALADSSYGWQNHPAVLMWRGYEVYLEIYMNCCIQEWVKRGFRNKMLICVTTEYEFLHPSLIVDCHSFKPYWFGDEKLHSSHRAALLAKDYNYYKQYNWEEAPKINYYWPV